MQINQEVLNYQRNKRAWSQSQLADVSGLSIRTIQRIEKTGSASQESVKALASVFEVDITELTKRKTGFFYGSRNRIATVASLVAFFISALIFLPASAKSIMVDVEINSNTESIAKAQLLSKDTKESEIVIDGVLRLVIKSVEEPENKVRIFAALYTISGNEEELVGTPELVTKNNKSAEIKFENYEVLLTPHL